VEYSSNGQDWTPAQPEATFPDDTVTREIIFPQPIVACYLKLIILSDHGKGNAAVVSEFEPLPDLSADARNLGIIPGFNDGK